MSEWPTATRGVVVIGALGAAAVMIGPATPWMDWFHRPRPGAHRRARILWRLMRLAPSLFLRLSTAMAGPLHIGQYVSYRAGG